MDEDRREALVRFNEDLAARGEERVSDEQLAHVEAKYGRIERLDSTDFADAVGDVAGWREMAPAFLPLRHRHERPAVDSPLAGEPWQSYLERHLERVLASFARLRDEARLMLELRPLSPGAPTSLAAAWAWFNGVEGAPLEDPDTELRLPVGREESFGWLVAYIAGQSDTGGSELLLWRGLMGEEAPVPFPASCYPLRNLRDLARRVADATGCRESEAAEWLLVDVQPPTPLALLVTSYPSLVEVYRPPGGEPDFLPHVSRRYVITVGSGLVSPDEVAALYRQTRNRDYGLAAAPSARQTVWSAEIVRFVDYERQREAEQPHSWALLWERWNTVYPQHPFHSVRAMLSSYRQAISRLKGRGEQKGAEP